jgi:hypothetical protein
VNPFLFDKNVVLPTSNIKDQGRAFEFNVDLAKARVNTISAFAICDLQDPASSSIRSFHLGLFY